MRPNCFQKDHCVEDANEYFVLSCDDLTPAKVKTLKGGRTDKEEDDNTHLCNLVCKKKNILWLFKLIFVQK